MICAEKTHSQTNGSVLQSQVLDERRIWTTQVNQRSGQEPFLLVSRGRPNNGVTEGMLFFDPGEIGVRMISRTTTRYAYHRKEMFSYRLEAGPVRIFVRT